MKFKLIEDFENYNANPFDKNVGDCTIRALSLAYNLNYSNVKIELGRISKELKVEPDTLPAVETFIKNRGFKKEFELENSSTNTVGDFVRKNHHGVYIIYCSNRIKQDTSNSFHLVTVIDGKVYDTWDSEDYYAIKAWQIGTNSHSLVNKVNRSTK